MLASLSFGALAFSCSRGLGVLYSGESSPRNHLRYRSSSWRQNCNSSTVCAPRLLTDLSRALLKSSSHLGQRTKARLQIVGHLAQRREASVICNGGALCRYCKALRLLRVCRRPSPFRLFDSHALALPVFFRTL